MAHLQHGLQTASCPHLVACTPGICGDFSHKWSHPGCQHRPWSLQAHRPRRGPWRQLRPRCHHDLVWQLRSPRAAGPSGTNVTRDGNPDLRIHLWGQREPWTFAQTLATAGPWTQTRPSASARSRVILTCCSMALGYQHDLRTGTDLFIHFKVLYTH